jgi:hypothetical protein
MPNSWGGTLCPTSILLYPSSHCFTKCRGRAKEWQTRGKTKRKGETSTRKNDQARSGGYRLVVVILPMVHAMVVVLVRGRALHVGVGKQGLGMGMGVW